MNLLAIDTSTDKASVAVATRGIVQSREQGALRQHAQLLLPMIEELMDAASLSFGQLDGIVFGQGPGSFTGLRIACSVAKGLAYAHDLPVYPVSSLAAIAYNVRKTLPNQPDEVAYLAVLDARMKQLYWGLFSNTPLDVQEQVSNAVDIKSTSAKPIMLAGVGFEAYEPEFSDQLNSQIISKHIIYPHAETMINMVLSGQIKSIKAVDALPAYIRNQVTHGESHG